MKSNEITIGRGSVQLVDGMGSPLSVVNSARVSMGKHTLEMTDKDWRLVNYLWTHKHTSPFRHVQFTFHIKAPIFVLRQWMKHQIGCAWNEISGRYVQFDCEFWQSNGWREQNESIKQGSGGRLDDEKALRSEMIYIRAIDHAHRAYEELLSLGVCKEQARTVLPVSLLSECYWSCSLHALIHFLKLRLDSHAQAEIREYAEAVRACVEEVEDMPRLLEIVL
jgi:thymidylate synthase (FAD)